MSNTSGMVVFTVTPELAKQIKGLRSGVTYVAQKATVASVLTSGKTSTARSAKKSTAKKSTAKKAAKKKSTKKKAAKQKVSAKSSSKKTKKVKETKRKSVKPDVILSFVKDNEGCNMTDIEGATKLPQATIRRVLNSARADGVIRTEGQRRGLRYYAGAAQQTVGAGDNQ